jgi:transcriptional repressor NrdR
MHCSKCGSLEDKVIDSRLSKDGRSIRRRRECLGCGHRYTTYEEIERSELRVLKRDGRSEAFQKEKLMTGMMKSCEKRPITREMIERAADEIIESLEQEFSREIPSHVVGVKVMEKLHDLDQVAYVRFASVYRTFQDIDQFIDELQKLGQNFKRSELQPELFRTDKKKP